MEPVKLAAPEVFGTVTAVHLTDWYPRLPNASRHKTVVCAAPIPSAFRTTAGHTYTHLRVPAPQTLPLLHTRGRS